MPDNPKWLLENEHAVSGKKVFFPDDATKYLDGEGNFTVPAGTGGSGAGQPGPPGEAGADGDPGPPGPQGNQGTAGATGATGSPGPPGMDGDPGEEGPPGRQGVDGATGAQGVQGNIGPQGPEGPEGPEGPPGPKGDTGPQGPAGGAGNVGTAVLNFGSFPGASDASVAVTGQAGIIAGSTLQAWVRPVATADHSADEHWVETLNVLAGNIVPGTGFTIYGKNTGQVNEQPLGHLTSGQNRAGGAGFGTRLYGQFNVSWQWS